jgi:hypothetical protein
MTFSRQNQIAPGYPMAIISNPNKFDATTFHPDSNLSRSCVNAVFDKFLDNRGRSFHHLTGCNLIDQRIG